jgi:hypothetical protein
MERMPAQVAKVADFPDEVMLKKSRGSEHDHAPQPREGRFAADVR